MKDMADALWEGHTVEEWTDCAQTDGRTDKSKKSISASFTSSLGGYNKM